MESLCSGVSRFFSLSKNTKRTSVIDPAAGYVVVSQCLVACSTRSKIKEEL